MLETLRKSIIINFSISLNSFIYFLKRGKITGLVFKNLRYEHADLAEVLVVFGIIYSMLNQLFKSAVLLLFSFVFPYLFLLGSENKFDKQSVYWQMFILFYILLSLSKNYILTPSKKKFICVKLMRMNAKQYIFADFFPSLIWRQLVEFLLFSLVASFFHVNIFLAIFLVIGKNLFSIFAEVINIIFYEKTGDFLHNRPSVVITYCLVVIVIGYVSAIANLVLIISTPVMLVLGICLWMIGLYAIFYIAHYPNFNVALNDSNRFDKLSINMQDVKKNAEFSRVKIKDKEFSKDELQYDKSNKKEGFHYINEIFFKRHKRILIKPIQTQSIIIVLLFILGIICSILVPKFNFFYVKTIKTIFPVFIFALYTISTGQKATKAMFYNCDISLLHYGFYKTKEAVLATFTIRAKHLILANIIPAGLLAIGLVSLDLISGGNGITLIPIGFMILVISIFFVIHNLFLYYIFQPYTTDLNVKNPFYKFLNFITYILCYLSLQLRNMSSVFLIVVVTLTIIYSIAALITVYKIAPKTFLIK